MHLSPPRVLGDRPPTARSLVVRWTLSRPGDLAACIATGILWTLSVAAVPIVAQTTIDRVLVDGDTSLLPSLVGVLLVLAVVRGLALVVRRELGFTMSSRVATTLRSELHAHLLRLDLTYHQRATRGGLLAVTGDDLTQVEQLGFFVPMMLNNVLWVSVVVVALVRIDPVLALVALASLPAITVLAIRLTRAGATAVTRQRVALGGYSTSVTESIGGVRAVKGLGAEAARVADAHGHIASVQATGTIAGQARARFIPVIELVTTLSLVLVLGVGGHMALSGRLTVGELTAFNAYVLMVAWPLRITGLVVAQAQRAHAAAERIATVLAAEPKVIDPPRPIALPRRDPRGATLLLDGVRFRYPRGDGGRAVLDGLDLAIDAGEVVALVGPTGAGKTTVARILSRLHDPQDGRVLLDGVPLAQLALPDLRRAVGVVPQDTFLFATSVRENVAFADPDAPEGRLRWAAEVAGAAEIIDQLPNGWDTIVGEQGLSLSGGQRQRLAIARALVGDPRLLVLDDATSAVDPSKEDEIRGALLAAMSGRTTLLIAHRPATLAMADRVVELRDGRIVAERAGGR